MRWGLTQLDSKRKAKRDREKVISGKGQTGGSKICGDTNVNVIMFHCNL